MFSAGSRSTANLRCAVFFVLWINIIRESGDVYVNITFCSASCGSLLDTEGVCGRCAAAAQRSALLME